MESFFKFVEIDEDGNEKDVGEEPKLSKQQKKNRRQRRKNKEKKQVIFKHEVDWDNGFPQWISPENFTIGDYLNSLKKNKVPSFSATLTKRNKDGSETNEKVEIPWHKVVDKMTPLFLK